MVTKGSIQVIHNEIESFITGSLVRSIIAQHHDQSEFTMSSLDSSLLDGVPLAIRPLATEPLWGTQPSHFHFPGEKPHFEADFDAYFKYYAEQCNLIGCHHNGEYSSVETHRDIMTIAQLLRKSLP
jgi:hypothetical protein